ncbi:MAG: AAA domain-containing protein [Candidatus Thalassarchaeaceae archaeon]|nr:AAA domain-containing protein [Euryarchaeota archaeon]MDG1547373.1 AAA domain-containing protein [Candidatus Thalassarchaeaceae archaeon]MDG1553592.1 AAA domain-containing protein [Candidatus Thalassarchaeaceae archaeon]
MGGDSKAPPTRFNRSQDHHELYLKLIRWELDDEMQNVLQKLQNWPKKRLIENGISLFDLIGKNDGWLFGQRIIKFTNRRKKDLGAHRFRQGDIILLSRKDPLKETTIEGTIYSTSRNSIKIVFSDIPKNIRKDTWRIDKGANRIAYDRMKDALNSVFQEEGGVPLRELLLGMVHDPPGTASLTPELGGARGRSTSFAHDLNEPQLIASKAAIERRLTLIQGPPGTGKTHTAVRILESWAKQDVGTILAVADSNVAVDNLLEGLLARGVRSVRLGQPVKVREKLRQATMDAQMEIHPLRRDLETQLELNEKLNRRISSMKGKEKGLAHRDIKKGWKEIRRIENQIRDDILDKTQIVCCTCIGSGNEILDGRRFSQVLIDEATQATEPASLVPLIRGARQIVLVGDHKQLPPTVLSFRAEEKGLKRSLFERLVDLGIEPFLLTKQYRMHPSISKFPNKQFYSSKLIDGVNASSRPAPAGLLWPDWDNPVAFIPIEGGELVSPDGTSRENPAEVSWVLKITEDLLEAGELTKKDIGIITPYAGQVRAIRNSMDEKLDDVEVRTVDGYQGREKEVIIFSCVRSNPEGNVGFLAEPRRLNVALTRAKRGLIVIGDPATLRSDKNWQAWLEYIRNSKFEAWHLLGMA